MARILIIDDEIRIRSMLRQMLERTGHEVVDAPDGDAGIKLYRNGPADLVITDLIMPEKEGLETIMELRCDFPDVKIIAISGGGRVGPTGYLEVTKKLGAQRIFAKPFAVKEILQAVHELIGH